MNTCSFWVYTMIYDKNKKYKNKKKKKKSIPLRSYIIHDTHTLGYCIYPRYQKSTQNNLFFYVSIYLISIFLFTVLHRHIQSSFHPIPVLSIRFVVFLRFQLFQMRSTTIPTSIQSLHGILFQRCQYVS